MLLAGCVLGWLSLLIDLLPHNTYAQINRFFPPSLLLVLIMAFGHHMAFVRPLIKTYSDYEMTFSEERNVLPKNNKRKRSIFNEKGFINEFEIVSASLERVGYVTLDLSLQYTCLRQYFELYLAFCNASEFMDVYNELRLSNLLFKTSERTNAFHEIVEDHQAFIERLDLRPETVKRYELVAIIDRMLQKFYNDYLESEYYKHMCTTYSILENIRL